MAGLMNARRTPGDRVSTVAGSIRPSGIRRFFDLVAQGDGVISLGVGEPDIPATLEVRTAAVNALMAGHTRYTPNAGLLQLRQAIAHYLHDRMGVQYDPAREICVTAGVAQGVDVALRSVVNPGDEVLIPEPCFVSYAPCTVLAGGRPIPVRLSPADGFRLTPGALAPSITSRSRVLLMSYPNNPTGAVMTRADYERLLPLIEQHDLTVISDEIYSELLYTQPHVCFAALPGMRDRTILLNGFSKTFSMTGWRLGYAAAPEPLLECMVRIHQHTLMCAPTTAQIGAMAALETVEEVVGAARAVYGARRQLLYEGLQALGLPCVEPQGAFYAFPFVGATGMTDEEFAERLLREEKVAVIPGSAFGDAGRGYIRCSYATATDKLGEALERMSRFVRRHGGGH